MSQYAIVTLDHLDEGLIITPERYDPRRGMQNNGMFNISDVAEVIAEQIIFNHTNKEALYLVLDTSDARNGIIRTKKTPILIDKIKSTKKIIKPRDVIISRLRPYLRQVAYVDELMVRQDSQPIILACSTEFYILRSKDGQSIAFLVPFLLSDKVQEVLAVSQEGGHHPRFNQATLQRIGISKSILNNRDKMSAEVESAVRQATSADLRIKSLTAKCSEKG